MNEESPSKSAAAGAAPSAPAPIAPSNGRGRRVLWGALAAVGMVALVVFALLGYRQYTVRTESLGKIDRATVLVEQADEAIVDIDEVVRAKVMPELAEEASAAATSVDQTSAKLNEAMSLIDDAIPGLASKDRQRAQLLRASTERRAEMLEHVPALLAANARAATALPLATEGWNALVEAAKLSEQAVAAYNKLTKEGVTQSRDLNQKAGTTLATAHARFTSAEKAFSAAPFEQYVAYTEARIELNKLSQQSDAAWLAGDIAKANNVIATYNEADKRAVALAGKLPETPQKAISSAFEEETSKLMEEYYAARDRALRADEALRSF